MQVDEKPIIPQPRNLDANFVDDDELQAALARSRKTKIHKSKKLSPEDVAKKSKFYILFRMLCSMLLQSPSRGQSQKMSLM
jgi:SART-1 family